MTPPDSRRIRLVSDAIVASYIHDISARAPAPGPRPGRRAAPAPEQIGSPTRVAVERRFASEAPAMS